MTDPHKRLIRLLRRDKVLNAEGITSGIGGRSRRIPVGRRRCRLACCCFVAVAAAQTVALCAEYEVLPALTTRQGLSHDSVNCIIEDGHGFVWIGTTNGLNRYDGNEVTVYRHVPGDPSTLCHSRVRALLADPKGMIWIGSTGGLDRLDPSTNQVSHVELPTEDEGPGSTSVSALYGDSHERLWIIAGGEVCLYDLAAATMIGCRRVVVDERVYSVSRVLEDHRGRILVLVEQGVMVFDPETGVATPHPVFVTNPLLRGRNDFGEMVEDLSGRLWIATRDEGSYCIDPDGETVTPFRHDPADPATPSPGTVGMLRSTKSGDVWLGTLTGTLDRFSRAAGSWERVFDTRPVSGSYSVDALLEDRFGMLWVGTYGGGVVRLTRSKTLFEPFSIPGSDPPRPWRTSVLAMLVDSGGNLWVGTERGLWRSGGPGSPPECVVADHSVRALVEDRRGRIWFASSSGLGRIEREDIIVRYELGAVGRDGTNNAVKTIFEDQSGVIWIGAEAGLHRYDDQHDLLVPFELSPADAGAHAGPLVHCIEEDQAGRLWIGTMGLGVLLLDRDRVGLTRLVSDPSDPRNLSSAAVTSIHDDPSGTVWIGTVHGLNRWHEDTGTFSRYLEEHGLANNTVYCVLSDRLGHIWISTDRGLSRFSVDDGVFHNYDASDGLQNNEFNGGSCHQGPDGELFFGGVSGINRFHPELLVEGKIAPTVVLTAMKVFGKEQQYLDPARSEHVVELGPRDNTFSFEFAVLDLRRPERNQYAYRLEGLDRAWIYAANRSQASYTAVPPGRYRFVVRGSSSEGVWSDAVGSVVLIVHPPYWQTWWFRLTAVVMLASAVLTGHWVRVSRVEAQRRQLAAEVERKTEEIREANRQLALAARTDPLTGLLNRRGIEERLKAEAIRSERSQLPFAVVMMDIDDFKRVNDALGHDVGDKVLESVAELIRGSLRRQDSVARWGGEEFLVLLPETDLGGGGVVAEKIRSVASRLRIDVGDDGRLSLTLTCGVAEHTVGTAVEASIAIADAALYRGKATGKNQVVLGGRAKVAQSD